MPRQRPFLYHVTQRRKVPRILAQGLRVGFTSSEREARVCVIEEETGRDRDEPDFWDVAQDDGPLQAEEHAREDFDSFLEDERPAGSPSHDASTFFWASKPDAEYLRRRMQEKNPCDPYDILTVDPKKVPCRCSSADYHSAEELFAFLEAHSGEYNPPLTEQGERRASRLAREYYQTMRPWRGDPEEDREVLCPCAVPRTGIVQVDGRRREEFRPFEIWQPPSQRRFSPERD